MSDRIYWCTPDRDREFAWWYLLVPLAFNRGRSGGRATLTICVGFVWSGFLVIHLGDHRRDVRQLGGLPNAEQPSV